MVASSMSARLGIQRLPSANSTLLTNAISAPIAKG